MTAVEVQGLQVRRQGRLVLDLPALAVPRGRLVAVAGENGAGKSTLLQALNLLLPYDGRLRLFGEEATPQRALALRRRSALLFQQALLLGGSVLDNVALPLRLRGVPAAQARSRAGESLALFQASQLARRRGDSLSGGEAQRVCLARALAAQPELLLLDEPFAALDAATRTALLGDLYAAVRAAATTVLLVSHHYEDLLYFAEQVLVLRRGRLLECATPEGLLRRPGSLYAARLAGVENVLPAAWLPGGRAGEVFCLAADRLLLGRPGEEPPRGWLSLTGRTRRCAPAPGHLRLEVDVDGRRVVARCAAGALPEALRRWGAAVQLHFDPAEGRCFAAGGTAEEEGQEVVQACTNTL